MRNTTHRHIPDPVSHMKINVRQVPGQSYPLPASRVSIREQNIRPGGPTTHAPFGSQSIPSADPAYCPPQ
jgi:hypothetical protein